MNKRTNEWTNEYFILLPKILFINNSSIHSATRCGSWLSCATSFARQWPSVSEATKVELFFFCWGGGWGWVLVLIQHKMCIYIYLYTVYMIDSTWWLFCFDVMKWIKYTLQMGHSTNQSSSNTFGQIIATSQTDLGNAAEVSGNHRRTLTEIQISVLIRIVSMYGILPAFTIGIHQM